MIKALAFQCGLDLEPRAVAELACYIENDTLGMDTGRQAAYAAAFGGLHSITFSASNVIVDLIRPPPGVKASLEKGLMLFSRNEPSLSRIKFSERSQELQHREAVDAQSIERAKRLALAIRDGLEKGDLDAFGQLLHRYWIEMDLKTRVDPFFAQCYDIALESGALGGKTIGVGHDDFLMLYCPEDRQELLAEALRALGLQRWPLMLDDSGVQVMQVVPWSWSNPASVMSWPQGTVMRDLSPVKSPNRGRAGGVADYSHP
jgi:D-glycero-alpha-D-manno-heptose-7-phosphate kinase